MTANELADLMDSRSVEGSQAREVSAMLRQQQVEIEALKKEAALQRLSDFTQEAESFDRTVSHMAGEYVSYNEPYIWMDDLGTWFTNEDYQNLDNKDKKGIFPLYTHPMRELTNEEITQIVSEKLETWNTKEAMIDFAREILRKAQDK